MGTLSKQILAVFWKLIVLLPAQSEAEWKDREGFIRKIQPEILGHCKLKCCVYVLNSVLIYAEAGPYVFPNRHKSIPEWEKKSGESALDERKLGGDKKKIYY